jgi:valacyclovir hydrolase
MPLISVSTGATLHYEDMQANRTDTPVILIHGLLGTARGHLGHVMDMLDAQGYPVIGLTLRGYGQSLPKPRDFPENFYHRDTDDLFAFMDAMDIETAHLIGFSDGGEVVLIAAGQQPERVASCIAIGAVGNFGAELRPVFQRTYPGNWITEADKQEHGFTDAASFTRGWVRSTTRMIDAGGDISLSNASNITCPLIIMLGKEDTLNPERYGQRFVERVKHGRVVMFACGHAVHDEQTEAFYNITLEHLQSIINQ